MVVVVVAALACALVAAWPSLVVRRVSPGEAARALEPPAPSPAVAPAAGSDALSSAAASLGKAVRAAVLAAAGRAESEPPAYGPALDAIVRRARRSRLWAAPLLVGVVLDVSVLATPMGWLVGLTALGLVLVVDALLVTCAIVMLALSCRRTVSDAERDRFLQAWGTALEAKAGRHRSQERAAAAAAEADVHGWERDAAPILDEALASELSDVRRRLAASGSFGADGLASQLDSLSGRLSVLEASPHRDGHTEAAAQTYAEQSVDALTAYLELAHAGGEDADKVSAVLGLANQALGKEADRLDGKARLNLDVTKRGTEALYGRRYGDAGSGGAGSD